MYYDCSNVTLKQNLQKNDGGIDKKYAICQISVLSLSNCRKTDKLYEAQDHPNHSNFHKYQYM